MSVKKQMRRAARAAREEKKQKRAMGAFDRCLGGADCLGYHCFRHHGK